MVGNYITKMGKCYKSGFCPSENLCLAFHSIPLGIVLYNTRAQALSILLLRLVYGFYSCGNSVPKAADVPAIKLYIPGGKKE